MNKYWVKYRYKVERYGEEDWNVLSEFVTISDLEEWWIKESSGDIEHELLEVVKL